MACPSMLCSIYILLTCKCEVPVACTVAQTYAIYIFHVYKTAFSFSCFDSAVAFSLANIPIEQGFILMPFRSNHYDIYLGLASL